MLLTDYFYSEPDLSWDIAIQCGVCHGVIRLPESDDYDVTSLSQLKSVVAKFNARGITPVIIEPLPNILHDHIKAGDPQRDECIEKFIKLMKNLNEVGITTVCFNFMAHYGWTRTVFDKQERGEAKVTGFRLQDFSADNTIITSDQLWNNYEYFIKTIIHYAEKYGIKLALHPDDPPLNKLGNVERIFTSLSAIQKGITVVNSPYLGVTFCQACYYLMGEQLDKAVSALREKIFFIHFRNVYGNKLEFNETFHDNGDIDMSDIMYEYMENGIDVPIRVDHVPTLNYENTGTAGYDTLGRLFAIGYMKGIIESVNKRFGGKSCQQ